jgi:crotonobetainyl-CoA:carnitine CoA-transferase CaiB-like acyl-CoA transferase
VDETTFSATSGPLSGLRIADFTRVLAGPYATMMLGDFGADVIKIESPDGDETRQWLPPVDGAGQSTYFASVNRNKRSLVCDLRTPQGLAEATALAETADIVIENFRPGVMDRFNLGWESLRERNPRLVYCSITGFGAQAGANMPGYDLLVQAVGGLMSITGPKDGPASKVGVAVVDVVTGLNAVAGILLAVRVRDETLATNPGTNASQRVEVNLLTSLLSALTNQASSTLETGISPTRTGNAHPSIAPYEVFDAADRPCVIAVGNDRQFRTLMRLIGAGDMADDERFATNTARLANRQQLRDILSGLLAVHPAAHWVGILGDGGVPVGLINSVAEAFQFAQSLGLDAVIASGDTDTSGGARTVANPITLAGQPARYDLPPPRLGQHTQARWRVSAHP